MAKRRPSAISWAVLIFDFRFLILDWHLEAAPAASNALGRSI